MIRGVYAITPDTLDTVALCLKVEKALQGGVRLLQYRNKSTDSALRLQQARLLRELTQRYAATFIINDDVQLALDVNADGVHLGQSDQDLRLAKQLLPQGKYLGASCYNQIDLAYRAIEAGATYVAFGAAFASQVKPNAPAASLSLYAQAIAELPVPVVAIGGIDLQNAPALIDVGVSALAVITALFSVPHITTTAERFSALFHVKHPT